MAEVFCVCMSLKLCFTLVRLSVPKSNLSPATLIQFKNFPCIVLISSSITSRLIYISIKVVSHVKCFFCKSFLNKLSIFFQSRASDILQYFQNANNILCCVRQLNHSLILYKLIRIKYA